MNYQKIYDDLICRAKDRILEGYLEIHHVVPKCMDGVDEGNVVKLTPEEHYLAHQLLVKMYPLDDGLKYAAHMMTVGRCGNKQYGWLKRKWIDTLKKKKVSEKAKKAISKKAKIRIKEKGHPRGMLGKQHSEETKKVWSSKRSGEKNWMYGRNHTEDALNKMRLPKTEEHKRKLSESKKGCKHPNYGKSLSINTRKKMSESAKNSPLVSCPNCGKVGKISPMHRWHFDNCRVIV